VAWLQPAAHTAGSQPGGPQACSGPQRERMALEEGAGANIFRQAAQTALNSSQDHIGQQERCSHAANLIIVHFLE
jgi:hypothetical protein